MKPSLDHVAALWVTADTRARQTALAVLAGRTDSAARRQDAEPAADGTPLLVNQARAARMLGVSRQTLFRWARQGVIRPAEIAGVRRYRFEDLQALARRGGHGT